MAIEFPLPDASPWDDQHGQTWVHNGKNWVRKADDPGIEEAPDDGQMYGRESKAWGIVQADEWYLGPKDVEPITDNSGNPLKPGHVYFDNTEQAMRVWDGVSWSQFSAQYVINTLGEYVWKLDAEIPVEGSLTWPDDYGANPANWINGQTFIAVYIEGGRKLNEINGALVTGDYTIDYSNNNLIFKNNAIPIGSTIVVQTGVISQDDHISVTDTNASGWAFVINEDDMISDLDTKLPTQQSVKAYVDAEILKVVDGGGTDPTPDVRSFEGIVFDFAGENAPAGAMSCDGQLLLITDYPKTYAAIGDLWANTGGAANPGADQFRLPPQELNGLALFHSGVTSVTKVGEYYPSQNKRHQHNADHGHTGVASNAPNHTHSVPIASSPGSAATSRQISSTTGYSNTSSIIKTGSGGSHSHTITMTPATINTGNEGGTAARPETLVYRKCIWVDPLPLLAAPQ